MRQKRHANTERLAQATYGAFRGRRRIPAWPALSRREKDYWMRAVLGCVGHLFSGRLVFTGKTAEAFVGGKKRR